MTYSSQLPIPFSGESLKRQGMSIALESAEKKVPDWGNRCYELLKKYLEINDQEFLCEYFRAWTIGKIETPPSDRAYGYIITKASRAGLIKHCGYAKVSNPKAHRGTVSIWRRA